MLNLGCCGTVNICLLSIILYKECNKNEPNMHTWQSIGLPIKQIKKTWLLLLNNGNHKSTMVLLHYPTTTIKKNILVALCF